MECPTLPAEPSFNALFDRVREEAAVPAPVPAAAPPSAAAPAPDCTGDDGGEVEVWSINLVYGELLPDAVSQLLDSALAALLPDRRRSALPRAAPAFIDLGSGEGIPCLVAATRFGSRLGRICGIEFIPRLHRAAERHRALVQRLLEHADPAIASAVAPGDGMEAALGAVTRIELICDSFLADPAPLATGSGSASSASLRVAQSESADGAGTASTESPPSATVTVPVEHVDDPEQLPATLTSPCNAAAVAVSATCSTWPALFDVVFCNGTW